MSDPKYKVIDLSEDLDFDEIDMYDDSKCSSLSSDHDLVNPTNIVNCISISSLKGIKAGSASPTDLYSVTFIPGTNFQGAPIKKGFQKVFITDTAGYPTDFVNESYALLYELEIYKLVKKLLVKNVNCHFVKVLGGVAGGITFEKLADYISTYSLVPYEDIVKNLTRNTNLMCYRTKFQRPAVTETVSTIKIRDLILRTGAIEQFKYGFILTEGLNEINFPYPKFKDQTEISENWKFFNNLPLHNVMKFYDLLKINQVFQEMMYQELNPNPVLYKHEFLILSRIMNALFQCATACYALYINGIAHNDLHVGNVLLQKTEQTAYKYVLPNEGDKEYVITSKYCALLYDWDRSYSIHIGKNHLLDSDMTIASNQTNHLIEQRDFVKLLCYLYKTLYVSTGLLEFVPNNHFRDGLMNCICKPKPAGVEFNPINVSVSKGDLYKNWWKNEYRYSAGPFGNKEEDMYKDFWDQIFTEVPKRCFLNSSFIEMIHPDVFKETLYTLPEIIDNLYTLKAPDGSYYVTRDFDPSTIKAEKTSVIIQL